MWEIFAQYADDVSECAYLTAFQLKMILLEPWRHWTSEDLKLKNQKSFTSVFRLVTYCTSIMN